MKVYMYEPNDVNKDEFVKSVPMGQLINLDMPEPYNIRIIKLGLINID